MDIKPGNVVIMYEIFGWMLIVHFVLQICLYGAIINGKDSYLRQPIPILELILNILFLVNYSDYPKMANVGVIRLIYLIEIVDSYLKSNHSKVVLKSLIRSLPSITSLIFFELLFFYALGILNVNFFKGKFSVCDNSNVPGSYLFTLDGLKASIITKADCISYGGDWVNPVQNFDNVFLAMGIIFRFVTTDGWIQVMFSMVDSKSIDYNPVYLNRTGWSYFCMIMIIVCNFLILNIFAGVVMETFISEKDKIGGYYHLNQKQSEWLDIQLFATNLDVKEKLTKPKTKFVNALYKFFMYSKWSKVWDVISIILSVLFFLMLFHRMPKIYEQTINSLILTTWVLLVLEVALKLITFGIEFYKSSSIVLDVVIVVLELIGMILKWSGVRETYPTFVNFLLCVRIVRLFKLTKYVKKGTMIYDILGLSIPYLLNMTYLMVIFITIYSVLGMSIFPYVKHRNGISSHANFSKFSLGFMTLLRVITGDGWNELMDDSLKQSRPNDVCLMINSFSEFQQAGEQFIGCGSNIAYFYYMSFMIIFSYILLNLLTGIVIEGFYLRARLSNSKIGAHHINKFTRKWREYDPERTGFVHWEIAKVILKSLKPPLGIDKDYKSPHILNLYFQSLRLPLYKDTLTAKLNIHMYDMILALSKSALLSDDKYQE